MIMAHAHKHQRTAILTDSAAGMPAQLLAQHGIHVAPMTIRVGDDETIDLPGTDYGGIYEAVRRDPSIPVTVSAPLPQVWRDAILSISANTGADSVLIITMSAHFSTSYDAARVGAQWAATQVPTVRVEVIDSQTVAGAQSLVCMAAADSANSGADIEAATEAATGATHRAQTVAMLGTLAQIHRVTRMPTFALKAARNLPIKPVVTFQTSEWSLMARPITRRSALRKVRTTAEEGLAVGDKSRAIVMHVQCEQDATRVADELAATTPAADITVCQMHPFAGVPAGAGTVGVAWLAEASRSREASGNDNVDNLVREREPTGR